MLPAMLSAKKTAVLDACILYSASLRDFLLRLGRARLFHPLWSETIQAEWIRSLLRNRPDLLPEKLERTRREMEMYFPHSLITGFEEIVPTLQLPDSDDRHVLAVAIHAKAKHIITLNLTDFPKSVLDPYQVEAIMPDDFVLSVIKYDAKTFLSTVAMHRAALTRPPKTVNEYLATLKKQGLFKTVAFPQEHENYI